MTFWWLFDDFLMIFWWHFDLLLIDETYVNDGLSLKQHDTTHFWWHFWWYFDDILMTFWCTFDWWTLCSSTADPLTTFWRHFWWPFNMEMTYLHGISWWKHEQLLMTFTILDENMTLLLMTFLTTKRGLIGMIQCKTQHTFDDILTFWWHVDICILMKSTERYKPNRTFP